MKRFIKMTWAALFVLVTAVACSDNMNQPASVYAALADDPQFSELVSAIDSAQLDQTLSGSGTFTVFAPTNAAFDLLPEDFLTPFNLTLSDLLTYHVLGSEVDAAQAIAAAGSEFPQVQTLESSDIGLFVDGSTLVLNGRVQVTQTDIQTGNGIIHVVDAVLFPDKEFPGTVVDVLKASPRFSTLFGAVGSIPALVTALSDESGTFTLFAPTNNGFELLPAGVVSGLTPAQLTSVLQYHVLGIEADEALAVTVAESPDNTVTTLNGDDLTLSLGSGLRLFVNTGSEVTATDITVTNGLMHVVDSVLLSNTPGSAFPGNVVEALSAYPRYSSLVAAVVEAGLVDALTGVTVFAPTNAAFAAAGVPPYPPNLDAILTYHVLGEEVLAADLVSPEPTLEGSDLTFDFGPPVVINGEIEVIQTDFEASDGVIHVIDGVLIPPQV